MKLILRGYKSTSITPVNECLDANCKPIDLQNSIKRVGDYGKFMARKLILPVSLNK